MAIDTSATYKDEVGISDQLIVFDLEVVEVETASKYHKSDLENKMFLAKIVTRDLN